MTLSNRSDAEAELQHGFVAMQPAGLSLLDENSVHFIKRVPPLSYAERMQRLEFSLCKLADNAPALGDRRMMQETELHVEAGSKTYKLTLVAPVESELSDIKSIQVPPAAWQKLLREPLLTAFIPVADPDGQGWFVSSANNPMEKQVRRLVRERACAIRNEHQERRAKLSRLFPH